MQGHKVCCHAGEGILCGRDTSLALAIPHDEELAPRQFQVEWDGQVCSLKHLDSDTPTLLGGEPVRHGEVRHAGWIRAGTTDFSVYVEDHDPPAEPPPPANLAGATVALATLADVTTPLYALVDAARDDRILTLLRQSVEPYRSLYDGVEGEILADAAPYIVGLPPGSRLRDHLLHEGWSRRWYTLISSQKPLATIRRHFRKFLRVELEGYDDPVYFRFYDPEVLRMFMASSTIDEQRPWFDGVIDAYFIDDARSPTGLVELVSG